MKRDMDNLNLRDAFRPMSEETRDLMMNTARSLKEEEPVKKATFRTVLIAACIIMATMAVAVAAGNVFGWTDFFKNDYSADIPKSAQEILGSSEPVSWQEGDVIRITCAQASTSENDADGIKVINLLEGYILLLHLTPYGIWRLEAFQYGEIES